MNTLKDMVLGKPAPLVSTFRLSYYSILNLMSRAEGQFTAEHVIRNSFHQFQHEKVFLWSFLYSVFIYKIFSQCIYLQNILSMFWFQFLVTMCCIYAGCIFVNYYFEFLDNSGFTWYREKGFDAWAGSCITWCIWRGRLFPQPSVMLSIGIFSNSCCIYVCLAFTCRLLWLNIIR